MKTTFFSVLLFFGVTSVAIAQSDDSKPKSDSPEKVSELRTDKSATQPAQSSTTKGVTEHGPNDINAVRTDQKPTQTTQVRSKPVSVTEPESSAVDTAQPE